MSDRPESNYSDFVIPESPFSLAPPVIPAPEPESGGVTPQSQRSYHQL